MLSLNLSLYLLDKIVSVQIRDGERERDRKEDIKYSLVGIAFGSAWPEGLVSEGLASNRGESRKRNNMRMSSVIRISSSSLRAFEVGLELNLPLSLNNERGAG